MTNIEVKILVGAATIAFLFALFLDFRKQKRIRLLIAHMKEKQGEKWRGLPWLHRVIPRIGLRTLLQTAPIDDAESVDAYRNLRKLERRQLITLIVGAVAIVVVLAGTRYWGWSW
jgi:hypothetical protein